MCVLNQNKFKDYLCIKKAIKCIHKDGSIVAYRPKLSFINLIIMLPILNWHLLICLRPEIKVCIASNFNIYYYNVYKIRFSFSFYDSRVTMSICVIFVLPSFLFGYFYFIFPLYAYPTFEYDNKKTHKFRVWRRVTR